MLFLTGFKDWVLYMDLCACYYGIELRMYLKYIDEVRVRLFFRLMHNGISVTLAFQTIENFFMNK